MPTQQSCDCLCGVNRLAESLLGLCLWCGDRAALGYSPSPLGSATLDTEGGGDGGEDGDEEVDDGFPGFFFHLLLCLKRGFALRLSPLVNIQCLMLYASL